MNFLEEQEVWDRIESLKNSEWGTEVTPVETINHNGKKLWLKRDDYYERAGVRGGKVRSAWFLCNTGMDEGVKGLCTAGAKTSPQINIIAHIAKKLGVDCRAHCPSGKLGAEVESAMGLGATILQHKPGYNTVIVARAREDAKEMGYLNVPFGMECIEAVLMTALQVGNLPEGVKEIVMPVGSAMSLSGVLWGLEFFGLSNKVKVTGVQVGANPNKRLEKYAPTGWEEFCSLEKSEMGYSEFVEDNWLGLEDGKEGEDRIEIDPIYEGKCKPVLNRVLEENRDEEVLFWIVGLR